MPAEWDVRMRCSAGGTGDALFKNVKHTVLAAGAHVANNIYVAERAECNDLRGGDQHGFNEREVLQSVHRTKET